MIENLLLTLLTVSLSTSLMILLLLAIVKLLRKRYSARWLYLAWLVIAVRLLFPVNTSLTIAHVSIPVPERVVLDEIADPDKQSGAQALNSEDGSAPVEASPRRAQSTGQILAIVWIGGIAVFLAFQTAVYLRFKRRLRYQRLCQPPERIQRVLERVGAEMVLKSLPELRINAGVPAPLLIGLFRPALLLPHANYTDGELNFILRHELVHYRRHDLWYKLLLLAANSVHWFNPLVWLMVHEAGKHVEMSCDDAVMARLQPSLRTDYCEIILNTLPVKGGPAMTTTFGSLKGNTKMRIDNLYDKSQKRRGIVSLCSMVLVTALAGGLIGYTPVSAAVTGEPAPSAKTQQTTATTNPRLTLVEREFTIAELQSMDICGAEVVASTENVSITRGGDTLKFSYYQLSDNEYEFTTVTDGGQTRTYWALLRQSEGHSDDPPRTIHISIPENFNTKALVAQTVTGNISVSDFNMIEIPILNLTSQSGNVTVNECAVTNFFIAESNTGNIDIRNIILTGFSIIIADTGDVLFQPQDGVSNYNFDFSTKSTNTITVNGRSYAGGDFEINPYASKTLHMDSGIIVMPGKKDATGAGTATFTIKDR